MLTEILAVHDYPNLAPDNGFAAKALRLLKIYGLMLLAMIGAFVLLVIADKYVTDVLHHQSLNQVNKHKFAQLFKFLGKPVAVMLICVIGPIFEELIFRSWLNFKKRQIVISVLIALFYLGFGIYGRWVPAKQVWIVLELSAIIMVILVIASRYLITNDPALLTDDTKYGWTSFSMIAFALMHISNYKPLDLGILWVYPIFVIPQLLIGWGITYIRLKNGFGWGLTLHILNNTVSIGLALFAKQY